jgi:hypothetical protein
VKSQVLGKGEGKDTQLLHEELNSGLDSGCQRLGVDWPFGDTNPGTC